MGLSFVRAGTLGRSMPLRHRSIRRVRLPPNCLRDLTSLNPDWKHPKVPVPPCQRCCRTVEGVAFIGGGRGAMSQDGLMPGWPGRGFEPDAGLTDMQWYMYHQHNVAFFAAFSA